MVGRFVATMGQHYWSLGYNLSEPMNLQLLLQLVAHLPLYWVDQLIAFAFRRQTGACKPRQKITAMEWGAYYLHPRSSWPDDFRLHRSARLFQVWHLVLHAILTPVFTKNVILNNPCVIIMLGVVVPMTRLNLV